MGGLSRNSYHRMLCCSAAIVCLAAAIPAMAQTRTFDIPAQDASKGIPAFAKQAGIQLLASARVTRGKRTNAVRGNYPVAEALAILLRGTELEPVGNASGPGIVTIRRRASATTASPSVGDDGASQAAQASANEVGMTGEEPNPDIVVTGTNIRGTAPPSSPLTTYSRSDIEKSGATSVDQFLRNVPQNFSENDRSTAQGISAATGSVSNNFGATTVDIHGVGSQATLVLLDGHRLAPAGDGQFADVSLLPLSAIKRIDILSDGASAIYGTDAISGVVNFVLRDDFRGAETAVRYGLATRGGDRELTLSQLVGSRWATGNIIVSGQYQHEGGLLSTERTYLPPQGYPELLFPRQTIYNFLASGKQDLFFGIELSGDAFYADRLSISNGDLDKSINININNVRNKISQFGFNLSLARNIGGGWQLHIDPSISRTIQNGENSSNGVATDDRLIFRSTSVGAKADGPIFALPGGDLKAAIGIERRWESLDDDTGQFTTDSNSFYYQHLGRQIDSAYAEVRAPIVDPENAFPLASALELNGAVRFDHYQAIGSTINPKFGAVWSPVRGLTFRTTYGTSFRAPSLESRTQQPFYYAIRINDPKSPTGTTDALIEGGLSGDSLQPERSRSFTAGVDFRPALIPRLAISASYFRTNYRDRIGYPPIPNGGSLNQILPAEALLAPFIVRNPSLALVQAAFNSPAFYGDFSGEGPSNVGVLFNLSQANVAVSVNAGIDATIKYGFGLLGGTASLNLSTTYLLENRFQPVVGGQTINILNDLGTPLKFRASWNLSWSKGPFGSNVAVHYANAYNNSLTTPTSRIQSWVTGDIQVSYKLGTGGTGSVLHGVDLSLSIRNFTDRRPPYAASPASNTYLYEAVGYDPANADVLGRVISLQIRKSW